MTTTLCGCYDYHTLALSGSDILSISSFFFNSFKDVDPSSFFTNSLGSNNSSNWFLPRLGTGPISMRETKDWTRPSLYYMYSPNLLGDGDRARDSRGGAPSPPPPLTPVPLPYI